MSDASVLIALSILYSVIDEALHWRRYLRQDSDPVEMWSHVGIFIGHGTTLSEASRELTEFARKYGIPVISSPNGMGCLDMRDPLSLGFIGRNGAYPANEAGRRADLVIALGTRLSDFTTASMTAFETLPFSTSVVRCQV